MKFSQWLETEKLSIEASLAGASPGAATLMAERAWVLSLVAAKYKEFSGEQDTVAGGGETTSQPTQPE